MRLDGSTDPGSGSGPFTGHRLAASALSTTNPLRPPVQVFRVGLAGVSVAFLALAGWAFLAGARFFVPNDSARVTGFCTAVDVVGELWAARGRPVNGATRIADARSTRVNCTS